MKPVRKSFNRALYQAYDKKAKDTLVDLLETKGHTIVNTEENYFVDVVSQKDGYTYFNEAEVKVAWKEDWPTHWEEIRIPERKQRLLDKYDGEVIRLALLSTHYRKPINFGESLLDQSKNILNKLYKNLNNQGNEDEISKDVSKALLDDLNTPLAISNLLKIKCSRTLLKSANLLGLLNKTTDEWFALNNKFTISENDIESLIQERDGARKSKDFKRADEIRDQLEENNVVLEDVGGQTIWRVKK